MKRRRRYAMLPAMFPGVLAVMIYAIILWIVTITRHCIPMSEEAALLLDPGLLGVSLISLLKLVNALFVLYLVLQWAAFATGTSPKGVAFWGTHGVALALLLTLQLSHSTEERFFSENRPLFRAMRHADSGEKMLWQKDYEGAVRAFSEAIELDPDCTWYHQERARACEAAGDFRLAVADYTRLIDLEPGEPQHYEKRGMARNRLRQSTLAIQDFDQAIELYRELDQTAGSSGSYEMRVIPYGYLARPYYGRGIAHYNRGEYDKAIEDCTAAIQECEYFGPAYDLRALVCMTKGEFDLALKDHNEALSRGPEDASFYYHRAVTRRHMGDAEGALEDLDDAIERDPSCAAAYIERGRILLIKFDLDRALANYAKAVEVEPDSAEAHFYRGWSLYVTGETDRAIQHYDRAIDLDPGSASTYYERAEAWLDKGERDRARADYTKAAELDPEGETGQEAQLRLLGLDEGEDVW